MLYRALYSFKKTHPSSLGFEESEEFIELPGASEDKNWYYAISSKGKAGYIPRNYVEKKETTIEEFKKIAEVIKEAVKASPDIGNREKGELLAKIDRSRFRSLIRGGSHPCMFCESPFKKANVALTRTIHAECLFA